VIRALSAKFITSSPSIKEAPSFVTSEVVFLGRSNVGKSSLINALVNQKNLAKSSSTPGKTQLINFFEAEFCEEKEESSISALFSFYIKYETDDSSIRFGHGRADCL